MNELLEIIYDNYYSLNNTLDFSTDREYMKFVYGLRGINESNIDVKKYMEKFKDNIRKELIDNIRSGNKDSFFTEKNFLHFVYPYEQTLERFQILYATIGDEEWKNILGFDYKIFIDVICFIIYRIYVYNDYKITKNKKRKKLYEELFPLSINYYFTKKELYNYFADNHTSIDKILELLSIDIKSIENFKDIYQIIRNDDNYVLLFIWDFIYNSYDIVENIIINYYKNKQKENEFYKKRGIEFENYCYSKLVESFPNSNIYKKLYYDDQDGNHEIDLLLENKNEIIIFECKSARFDIHTTNNDSELKREFLRAFGNGYKTIDNFNNYVTKNNVELYSKSNKQKYCFDFKRKNVFYINITLHNMEYLQTGVQKIDKSLIKPVGIYPINWNYIDFLTIMELAKMNPVPVLEYIYKRFKMINNNKKITLDVDEIDVLGFLTDEQNLKVYKMLIENDNGIDTNFIISNGLYRQEINKLFNERMFNSFFSDKNKGE